MGCYFVYILKLQNGSFYVGSTADLDRRLTEHCCGCGGATTSKSPPTELLYAESHPDQKAALARERQLKRWSRSKKQALIAGNIGKLKDLARCRQSSQCPVPG